MAQVTPSSKAATAGIVEGLLVRSINNANCEDWMHSDALNSIKKTGSMLKLILCRQVKEDTWLSVEGGEGGSEGCILDGVGVRHAGTLKSRV